MEDLPIANALELRLSCINPLICARLSCACLYHELRVNPWDIFIYII